MGEGWLAGRSKRQREFLAENRSGENLLPSQRVTINGLRGGQGRGSVLRDRRAGWMRLCGDNRWPAPQHIGGSRFPWALLGDFPEHRGIDLCISRPPVPPTPSASPQHIKRIADTIISEPSFWLQKVPLNTFMSSGIAEACFSYPLERNTTGGRDGQERWKSACNPRGCRRSRFNVGSKHPEPEDPWQAARPWSPQPPDERDRECSQMQAGWAPVSPFDSAFHPCCPAQV